MPKKDVLNIIDLYNKAEINGLRDVTNSAIMAFSPYYWNNNGFPIKINSIKELWRYHDTMQDERYLWNKKCIRNCKVEKEDLSLLEDVKNKIYQFSCVFDFPYKSPAINALTRSFYQYLRIKGLIKNNQKEITILEVGPGCGYLGVFLSLSGYKYIAIECVQAYYVYQSSLWNHIFKNDYNNGISKNNSQKIRHIVWWEFNKLNFKTPEFDIFTANHVFSEMHPFAVNRFLKTFNLNNNDNCIGFVDCLGHEHTSYKKIFKKFIDFKINVEEIYPENYLLKKSSKKGYIKLKKISYFKILVTKLPSFFFKRLENIRSLIRFFERKIIFKSYKDINRKKSFLSVEQKIDEIFGDFSDHKTPDSIYLSTSDL